MMPKIRIVRTRSVVATGRSMNVSAKFIVCSLRPRRLGRLARLAALTALPRPPRPPSPRPAIDTCAPGVSRSWPSITTSSPAVSPLAMIISSPVWRATVDRPHLRGAIGADDVDDTGPRPTAAPRSPGTTSTFSSVVTLSVTVHEQPRPEALVGVLERAFQLDRAGRRIDGVVDEADAAGFRRARRHRRGRALAGRHLSGLALRRGRRRRLRARRHRGLAARDDRERLLRLDTGGCRRDSGPAPRTTRKSARPG